MFNFFKKSDSIKLNNTITFGLSESNNEPFVKINVMDTNLKDAEYFGRLLYDINIGLYKHDIMKTMLDMAKQDLHINQFMQKSLLTWSAYLELKSNKKDEPIISPSQFSRHSK